jgi:hypothetical protein
MERRSKFENGDGCIVNWWSCHTGKGSEGEIGRTRWKVKNRNKFDEKKKKKYDDASLFRLRRGVVLVICIVLYIYIWDIIIIHQKDA